MSKLRITTLFLFMLLGMIGVADATEYVVAQSGKAFSVKKLAIKVPADVVDAQLAAVDTVRGIATKSGASPAAIPSSPAGR